MPCNEYGLLMFLIFLRHQRVITTDEIHSHETSSVEVVKSISETVQIALGEDEIEALQRRYRFRKILPACLSSIQSKMFLPRALSIGQGIVFIYTSKE